MSLVEDQSQLQYLKTATIGGCVDTVLMSEIVQATAGVQVQGHTKTVTTEDSDQDVLDRDINLIASANKDIEDECLLAASRLLRQVKNIHLLTEQHNHLLAVAQEMEDSTVDLLEEPDDSWSKQSEMKSKENSDRRETAIYYKISGVSKLECRIDCVVESSLLVPLLAVFNETPLYETWIPSWTFPVTMGIKESKQLKQVSRGHQIVHITANVPWPMSARDVVLRAIAADDIAANNAIVVRMRGIGPGDNDNVQVPSVDGVVRADFEGAILIRPCPESKWPKGNSNKSKGTSSAKDSESRVLVSFKMFVDPHLSTVPTSLINFVTRTVMGTMWKMLLQVAEGVREGKRPLHEKAIQERSDLYEWINARIHVLLQKATG